MLWNQSHISVFTIILNYCLSKNRQPIVSKQKWLREAEKFLQSSCILNSLSLKGQNTLRRNRVCMMSWSVPWRKLSSPSCPVHEEDAQRNDWLCSYPRYLDLLPSKGTTGGKAEKKGVAKILFCRCLWLFTGCGGHKKPSEKSLTSLPSEKLSGGGYPRHITRQTDIRDWVHQSCAGRCGRLSRTQHFSWGAKSLDTWTVKEM